MVKIVAAVSTLVLLAASFCLAAGAGPVKPGPHDKCPVCGMFVAKYPDFIGEIVFKDHSYAVFDGAKDMFKYYQNLSKYDSRKKLSDIESIYVTDYYDMKLIDGFRAFYVVGSNAYGPMGKELVPFLKEADAREFMADHTGRSLLKFKSVTPQVLRTME